MGVLVFHAAFVPRRLGSPLCVMPSPCLLVFEFGDADPTPGSKRALSSHWSQACAHPVPQALGQGGAISSGSRSLAPRLGTGAPPLLPDVMRMPVGQTVAAAIKQPCPSHLRRKPAQGQRSGASGRIRVPMTLWSYGLPTETGFLLLTSQHVLLVTSLVSNAGPTLSTHSG